ncbi:tudor domain-containing protein 7A isoform X2 [Drosophila gunungcola]|nr:tudor domain-containing protein 7A isoform X2 [Drosophila gunungcola]XP_052839988.1 tudor domain-containing protein 7A isoform X2 [Drosophila gunungcola]XP_052839989.1 tudor domain-containing protein 7A isoform X2 [Drosophila gunungcola]XP_052839990.1 tudor domain-containing protein 7A isoform X2 [Drosophila gunungcola]
MVRKQKCSKSRSISKPSPAAQRANSQRANNSCNSHNNNHFQSNYQHQQQRSYQQQQYWRPPPTQVYLPPAPQQFHPPSQVHDRWEHSRNLQQEQQKEQQKEQQRRLQEQEVLARAKREQDLREQELSARFKREEELRVCIEQELKSKLSTELQARLKKEQARFEEEFQVRLKEQLQLFKKHQEHELKKRTEDLENQNKAYQRQKQEEELKEFKNKEQQRREQESKEQVRKKQEKKEQERIDNEKRDRCDRYARKTRQGCDQSVDMRSVKLDHEKIVLTIANDKAPAMNGHGQNHVGSNGQGKYNGGKPPLRAILGHSAPQRHQAPSSVFNTPESSYNRPFHPRVLHPGMARSTGSSVNHRLKVKSQSDAPAPAGAPITPPASPENAQIKSAAKPSPKDDVLRVQDTQVKAGKSKTIGKPKVPLKINASFDAVSSLNLYCEANGFEKPSYNIFNKPPRLHCSVRIDGDVYSSYPEEFAAEETAYQRTAQIAIQRIQHAESHQQLSVCTLSNEEFIDGLHKELLKYPHGILGHKLEDWYGSTFRQHLPSHWYDLIIESNKIRVEHGIDPRIILFANDPGIPEPIRISTNSMLPQLKLPWQSSESGTHDLNMFISHCDSTKRVWARLIDQIANFEELTKHMGRQMAVPLFRQKVGKPYVDEIYLVELPDGWNRVRVISVNEEQRSCSCHFVDFGDVALFESEELFQCPPQFLVLPPQAVCLSMYALDKFEDHPHAQAVLTKELDGQSVVAHVLTTEAQFLELGGDPQGVLENGKRRACLVATLYDTSTAEDIHLNDLVAGRITKCTPAPTLCDEEKIGKTTPVLVSHINDDGDLLVLLRNDDLKFVERSIAQTVADLGEQDRVSYSDLLHDRHVFVCDESVEGLKQWFRGRLATRPKNPEEETFDVYYVDDGRQRKTHISNIYRLEANNRALATFPPQALPVRLHDVPEIAGQMLGRLRGLMPARSQALLKVVAKDGAKPLVNVFIRGQDPESMYMCVNIGLRMEFEMAGSIHPERCDDLPLSSNVQLPRRSSFSSVVSSQSSGSDLVALTPPVTPQRAASTRSGATTFSSLLLKDYEAIPAVGAYFEVRVSLSVNPGHFAVQPYKCYNQLQNLMKDLQKHCTAPAAKGVQPSQLAIGEAYAAPDSDGVYHRVNIRKIYDEIIHVRFVDVGDDGVVACDQLKTLQPDLRKLPKMALPAQLYGIQLADVVWSKDNCVRFRELTLGQKFIGIVRRLHKQKDETRALCLELVDTSTPKDIKLHEILISEKHAQPETKEV